MGQMTPSAHFLTGWKRHTWQPSGWLLPEKLVSASLMWHCSQTKPSNVQCWWDGSISSKILFGNDLKRNAICMDFESYYVNLWFTPTYVRQKHQSLWDLLGRSWLHCLFPYMCIISLWQFSWWTYLCWYNKTQLFVRFLIRDAQAKEKVNGMMILWELTDYQAIWLIW